MDVSRLLLFIWISLFSQLSYALELSPLSNEPYMGDLDVLKTKGTVRVLVSADLGFYYIEDGKPKGIVAEMLYHFEKSLRKKHPYLNVQIIPVQRDDLLPSLESGYGDVAVANLTITDKRLRIIDFSDPMIKDGKELIITGKNSAPITEIKQLSGKEVWIRASSSYFESVQRVNKELNELDLPPLHVHFIEESLQDYELIELVNQGYIQGTILDSHKAKLWTDVMENIQVHHDLPLRENGQIAWALRKNSPQLKKEINKYVKTARTGTLLGNVIYQKYIDNTRWLGRALNPNKIDRVAKLSDVFEKYSSQYEFDPLMISAQGFQESGLDQSRVSHRGAIGVMQVLPSTAKDKNVNIKNIHKVDNNIHAGVKYMRFIKDRYFDDPAITPDNQIYFTLASYNAGPAKIRKMRRIAKQKGYNPNIWFKNVEIITRKYVSKEPVTYVANINRYFVIYKQLQAINAIRENGTARLLKTND
ncbi:lytic transglycosylase F [Vibrio splendidus]|uniref:transporter substrate-binding domain-containing protein n=1 Tax=Vibrio splendidus TaxID=29497 RepID=UPI003144E829